MPSADSPIFIPSLHLHSQSKGFNQGVTTRPFSLMSTSEEYGKSKAPTCPSSTSMQCRTHWPLLYSIRSLLVASDDIGALQWLDRFSSLHRVYTNKATAQLQSMLHPVPPSNHPRSTPSSTSTIVPDIRMSPLGGNFRQQRRVVQEGHLPSCKCSGLETAGAGSRRQATILSSCVPVSSCLGSEGHKISVKPAPSLNDSDRNLRMDLRFDSPVLLNASVIPSSALVNSWTRPGSSPLRHVFGSNRSHGIGNLGITKETSCLRILQKSEQSSGVNQICVNGRSVSLPQCHEIMVSLLSGNISALNIITSGPLIPFLRILVVTASLQDIPYAIASSQPFAKATAVPACCFGSTSHEKWYLLFSDFTHVHWGLSRCSLREPLGADRANWSEIQLVQSMANKAVPKTSVACLWDLLESATFKHIDIGSIDRQDARYWARKFGGLNNFVGQLRHVQGWTFHGQLRSFNAYLGLRSFIDVPIGEIQRHA